jgi:hypothetical protein
MPGCARQPKHESRGSGGTFCGWSVKRTSTTPWTSSPIVSPIAVEAWAPREVPTLTVVKVRRAAARAARRCRACKAQGAAARAAALSIHPADTAGPRAGDSAVVAPLPFLAVREQEQRKMAPRVYMIRGRVSLKNATLHTVKCSRR